MADGSTKSETTPARHLQTSGDRPLDAVIIASVGRSDATAHAGYAMMMMMMMTVIFCTITHIRRCLGICGESSCRFRAPVGSCHCVGDSWPPSAANEPDLAFNTQQQQTSGYSAECSRDQQVPGSLLVHCAVEYDSGQATHTQGRTGQPGTCQVGRLVWRPGGPPHQMLK